MKLNDILKNFTEASEADFEQQADRRSILKNTGAKIAAAAVPFALSSLTAKKANAQSKETIIRILNYLMKLELIVEKLFKEALNKTDLIPADLKHKFQQMSDQNAGHRTMLSTIIVELGGTVLTIDENDIDLTGDYGNPVTVGPFTDSLHSFDNLLIQMQMFFDGGARMYKGQTFEVMSDNATVTALMGIHSVKTRQATYVRFLRNYWYNANIKPWITGTNTDVANPAVQRAYAGEGVNIQRNINIEGINGFDIGADAATQAFDEPMNMDDGNIMINRFIKI